MITVLPLTTKDGYQAIGDTIKLTVLVDNSVHVSSNGYVKDEARFLEEYSECHKAIQDYIQEQMKDIMR